MSAQAPAAATQSQDPAKRWTVPRGVPQLEAAIREFIDAHHADPKPFVWTKTADGPVTAADDVIAEPPHDGGRRRGFLSWPRGWIAWPVSSGTATRVSSMTWQRCQPR